jgi:PAS domain S-box-containing protein
MVDISERKIAENLLKENEEKFRTIFNNSAVAITVTDHKERITSWNPFTEELLGFGHKELFHRKVKSLYPEKEWRKIRSMHIKSMGKKHHLETKMLTKGGRIDVDISISVLKDHLGNVIGSIGVIRDISDRKRNEEKISKFIEELTSKTKELQKMNVQLEKQKNMLERFREATVDQVLEMKKIEKENIKLKERLKERISKK